MSAPLNAHRAWCGLFCWPGREPIQVGTVFLRAAAPAHEIEAALRTEFSRLWDCVLPEGVPHPLLKDYRPGMLVFLSEEDRA